MNIFKMIDDKNKQKMFDKAVQAEEARREAVEARNHREAVINAAIASGVYDENGKKKKEK